MPVVLGMWSCSVTILVCLTIWDLLGFVLLDLLLGGRAMHDTHTQMIDVKEDCEYANLV